MPVIAATLLAGTVGAQTSNHNGTVEATIRTLEKQQVEALLRRDLETLDSMFADELVVRAPNNQVTRKSMVMQLIRERRISYSSFKVEIDEVIVRGDTVIVTGKETVEPIDDAPFAGTTVERRYSQVWMNQDGKWRLVFRHASLVCRN